MSHWLRKLWERSTRRHGKTPVHPNTPPWEYPLAPRTDLPPYHKHLDLADPLACINAITTAICTAAAGAPTSQMPAITNAVVTVIKDSAFFVADRSSTGRSPTAVAAAIATAIANVANSSATAAAATTRGEAIACSWVHLYPLPLSVVKEIGATFLLLDREVMAVVSAACAPAVACAIDSAVTSVNMAVAVAADRPGGCMRATAEAYAEHASRIAQVFVDAVDDLTVKSC
ncbi:hypothetical protein V8F06_008668 [Rhypophila decipiens]